MTSFREHFPRDKGLVIGLGDIFTKLWYFDKSKVRWVTYVVQKVSFIYDIYKGTVIRMIFYSISDMYVFITKPQDP